jgi:hypothetical protein
MLSVSMNYVIPGRTGR